MKSTAFPFITTVPPISPTLQSWTFGKYNLHRSCGTCSFLHVHGQFLASPTVLHFSPFVPLVFLPRTLQRGAGNAHPAIAGGCNTIKRINMFKLCCQVKQRRTVVHWSLGRDGKRCQLWHLRPANVANAGGLSFASMALNYRQRILSPISFHLFKLFFALASCNNLWYWYQ